MSPTSFGRRRTLIMFVQACKTMGISRLGKQSTDDQSIFSEDVLKVELCGSNREHLNIIDVPSIFRTPTPGITTKHDIDLVKRIVESYIRNAQTIILAVIPANVDIATQEILTMAEHVDPNGQRTLGVLTKPDPVDKGAESDVIDLVQGKRNQLLLGYCIVRNRGQRELAEQSSNRHWKEAEFFSTSPWAGLSKDQVGIFAFKARLRELLVDLTRKVFLVVKLELNKKFVISQQELSSLGASRETTEDQRRYLQKLASTFTKITESALDARYSRYDLFNEHPDLRLATIVRHLSDQFAEHVRYQGHSIGFLDQQKDGPDFLGLDQTAGRSTNTYIAPFPAHDEAWAEADARRLFKKIYLLPDSSNYPELLQIFEDKSDLPIPQTHGILQWIKEEFKASRGFALGASTSAVSSTIWKAQCWKWEGLALAYINRVILVVHHFICKLFRKLCLDDRLRSSLLSQMNDNLCEKYRTVVEHVKFIVKVERVGALFTANPIFHGNLEKARQERSAPAVDTQDEHKDELLQDTILEEASKGNTEQEVREIHDTLRSYYDVTRERFIDSVCKQGSDHFLITGPASPLKVFSTDFIIDLTPEQLEWIAGEELTSKRRRQVLMCDVSLLKEGKKILAI